MMQRPLFAHRADLFWFLVLAVAVTALSVWAVNDFSQPLSDGNDTDVYEYVGYYFWKNVSFWPMPHLNLTNNQTFYPYGTNSTFLDWGFERDYWYAFCYWLNGNRPGPFLQYYYVYSLVVTALGSFWLLRNHFATWRLVVFGLAVSVFNFYALFKFPIHLNVCVAHYTVLCIIATYRLLSDVLDSKSITPSFLVGWATLHVLVLSQELGYVAGFGLMFTVVVIGSLVIGHWSLVIGRWSLVIGHWSLVIGHWSLVMRHCSLFIGHCLLFIAVGWLYLPLVLQIVFNARQFNFGDTEPSRLWSHPARLLISYLPGVDQLTVHYERFFGDSFESFGQGSPGLWLVIAAAVGWWHIRHRVALWLPIALMLALCLCYHPTLLPTLKIFPWFAFNRHGGRASLIYPVLLGLLALHLPVPKKWFSWLLVSALALLMLAEWIYPYWIYKLQKRPSLPASFFRYVDVVKNTPGEAVLDWPFCTTGADGPTASAELCPHYQAQNVVFTFRRFYDKKGVGQYFGRLSTAQIEPFRRDGWPRLLAPGHIFTETDWLFLNNFLKKNNFAGINLYPDLLPPQQIQQFYARYGKPIAETRFPAAGRVQFLEICQ
jgi:hypothetical protein